MAGPRGGAGSRDDQRRASLGPPLDRGVSRWPRSRFSPGSSIRPLLRTRWRQRQFLDRAAPQSKETSRIDRPLLPHLRAVSGDIAAGLAGRCRGSPLPLPRLLLLPLSPSLPVSLSLPLLLGLPLPLPKHAPPPACRRLPPNPPLPPLFSPTDRTLGFVRVYAIAIASLFAGSQAVHWYLAPDTRVPLEAFVDAEALARARARLGEDKEKRSGGA